MSKKRRRPSFRVGDRVRVDYGLHKVFAVVVEDRGPIGIHGRQLFQVEIPIDPFEPMRVERPEDEMELIPPEEDLDRPMDKQKIIDYLRYGGLVSMLWANFAGGTNQPRAWLCRDQLGNVTHTFNPDRGGVGGQIIPSWALREHKIFAPKLDSVLSFLQSFDLDRQEAEKVVSEVGTAP